MSRLRKYAMVVLAAGCGALPSVAAPSAEPSAREEAKRLLSERVIGASARQTRLRPEYLRAAIVNWKGNPGFTSAYRASVDRVLNVGPKWRPARAGKEATGLVRLLENQFILDPRMSSLDLLPPEQRDRFVHFPWHKDDFPGGAPGPNETVADEMADALTVVRPERRANSKDVAVARRDEIERTGWDWVLAMQAPIPGQEQRKLHREAVASFVRMRSDARRDGVELYAVSANRDPSVAARNAARSGNPNAVASFSSHSLGLAVDFRMSDGRQNFAEVSTGDMPGLVRMRQSAVHKWLFLRGDAYGWFPYMQEPWHWEFNPIGFRERFWSGAPAVPTTARP